MTGPFCGFFQLRDNPFRSNPDPRYLFLTAQAQGCLDQLLEGIRARKGLLLLTGEVGTGKTLLIHRLLDRLALDRTPRAFIFNSHLNVSELFELILAEFGIAQNAQRGSPLAHLNTWLQDQSRAGQTPVLFVDEAQGLPSHVLEELRLLLNLQNAEGNLLQIVLSGQPEFEETLRRPELRQIRQRVALRCRTAPLTLEETCAYIQSRLRFAGALEAVGAETFQPEAVQALFLYSRGIPRVLNLLCEQSLMRAASEGVRTVTGRLVGEAAQEFQYDGGRTFVATANPDERFFSGLFAPRPAHVEAPEMSPDATSVRHMQEDGDVTVNPALSELPLTAAVAAPITSVLAHASVPQLARLSLSGAAQTSNAPIMFPSPSQQPSLSEKSLKDSGDEENFREVATSAQQLIAELSAASNEILFLPGAETRIPANDRPSAISHRRIDSRSIWILVKATPPAIRMQLRVLVHRLRPAVKRSHTSLSRQWGAWQNKIRSISSSFEWLTFPDAWLQWLRSPSGASLRRQAALESLQAAAHAAAVTPATPIINTPQSSQEWTELEAPSSVTGATLQRRPSGNPLIASILHWLQQPSGTLRARQTTRPSNTRIA